MKEPCPAQQVPSVSGRFTLLALSIALVISCGTQTAIPDAGEPADAGQPADAGLSDAGQLSDAGPGDAGHFPDAGPGDAGHSPDAGLDDAGHSPDAGLDDAGHSPDAGPGDAGHSPDAGPRDAGSVLDGGDGGQDVTVVIAAAGDISDPMIDDQLTTANLVIAGHYDAVLTIGDNQYLSGTETEFFDYFGPTWGKFKANIFPALGNHEYESNPPASGYFDYFFNPDAGNNNPRITDPGASDPTRGYYSYDLGAWHLIALNTNTATSENDACQMVACDQGSAQEQWLANDLATHSQLCTLAYWHQARFTAGNHNDDPDVQALWNDLYAANADVILNGHDHNYQRWKPLNPDGGVDPARGIVEFIVGTGGTTIVSNTKSSPANMVTHENGTYGFLQLTLRPTGYDYEFIPATQRDGGVGVYTDKGSGNCH